MRVLSLPYQSAIPVRLLALLTIAVSCAAPAWAQEFDLAAVGVPLVLNEAFPQLPEPPSDEALPDAMHPSEALPGETAPAGVAPLPPLEAVLDAVRAHSPRLRSEEATVQRYAAHLRSMRARWMDNVTVGAASTYGTYGSALIDELSIGTQAMVTVRVSLYDVLGQRHDVRAQRAQLEEVRELANVALRDEERLATDLYHRATLAAELVAVRTAALQTTRSHALMAERAFARGHLSVADLAQVAQVQAEAEAAYETARADYRNAYAQLELIAGQPLSELVPPLAERTTPAGALDETPDAAYSAEDPDRP